MDCLRSHAFVLLRKNPGAVPAQAMFSVFIKSYLSGAIKTSVYVLNDDLTLPMENSAINNLIKDRTGCVKFHTANNSDSIDSTY